jgi:hypothetical protein
VATDPTVRDRPGESGGRNTAPTGVSEDGDRSVEERSVTGQGAMPER